MAVMGKRSATTEALGRPPLPVGTMGATPPPPPTHTGTVHPLCENNAHVRTAAGVVSATFGACPDPPPPTTSEQDSVVLSHFGTLVFSQGGGGKTDTPENEGLFGV